MECSFRPRDRDPTAEDMEEVWMGYWAVLEGCWAATQKRPCGYPVNRLSIKRPPSGMKLDRRSTGGVPRPLGKTRSIPRTLNTRSQRETKGGPSEEIGAPECKTDNGENAWMHETNTYAKCDAHDDMI